MGVSAGGEDWWVCLRVVRIGGCVFSWGGLMGGCGGEEPAPNRVISPSREMAQCFVCCIALTSLLQVVRAGRSLLPIRTVCIPSCMCRRVTEAPLLPEASLWSGCFSECTSA